MLFTLFLFSCVDGRSSSGQPAWPQLDSTDTPATLDEGPFDAAVTLQGFPLGGDDLDSMLGFLSVRRYASPASRTIAEAFFGDDEDCSLESRSPALAEEAPDHVLVNVGTEVISVPQYTAESAGYTPDSANYWFILPDEIPAGTPFGLSGTQTLTLLALPDLTQDTITALDDWTGRSPIDIAWTPGSEETFLVDGYSYTEPWDASCRVVNDGLWTLPAVDDSESYWDLWIGRGRAVAVDSPELGHVLLYTWSYRRWDYERYDDYDDPNL